MHELNHVINRSEVGYRDDFPTSAFVHEYRAFAAEARFEPAPYDGVDLVVHVIELYELTRADLDPAVLAAPLTPRMLPDDAAWRARKVASPVTARLIAVLQGGGHTDGQRWRRRRGHQAAPVLETPIDWSAPRRSAWLRESKRAGRCGAGR